VRTYLGAVAALVLAGCAGLGAAPQSAVTSGGLPTQAEVEASLRRTLGYAPGLTWQIYSITPSSVPGVADIVVSINKQNPMHIYYSPSSGNAIVGEMIPFGADPFAPARRKLQAADGPALGSATPGITAVIFTDLECPHCKAAEPVLERLSGDFPQVRFIFEEFPLPAPLHPWAMKAAEYAECARGDTQKFWKYVDSILENQGGIAAATADAKLQELASAAGLDGAKVAACAASPETEARVKKSVLLGQSLDVTQTPTVFINGRRVLGVADIPYDQLKNLMQFEIEHAGR
jgi:protein-disulfide isomerase